MIVTIWKPHGYLSDMDVDVGFVQKVAFTEITYAFQLPVKYEIQHTKLLPAFCRSVFHATSCKLWSICLDLVSWFGHAFRLFHLITIVSWFYRVMLLRVISQLLPNCIASCSCSLFVKNETNRPGEVLKHGTC